MPNIRKNTSEHIVRTVAQKLESLQQAGLQTIAKVPSVGSVKHTENANVHSTVGCVKHTENSNVHSIVGCVKHTENANVHSPRPKPLPTATAVPGEGTSLHTIPKGEGTSGPDHNTRHVTPPSSISLPTDPRSCALAEVARDVAACTRCDDGE